MAESFRYCFAHTFAIDAARKLIEARQIPYTEQTLSAEAVQELAKKVLDADRFEKQPDGSYQRPANLSLMAVYIDPEAALALTPEEAARPGLRIVLPDENGRENALIIDGHHRLFRAYVRTEPMRFQTISDPAAIRRFYSHPASIPSLLATGKKKEAAVYYKRS